MKPVMINIRTYQVGFGDCFLVSFFYDDQSRRHILVDFGTTSLPADAPKRRMLDVAENIRKFTGGKLTAVVATHRHMDHVSGFATGPGKPGQIIADLMPDLVLQPWTEDPNLAPDATGKPIPAPPGLQGAAYRTASLAAMQKVSGEVLAELRRSRHKSDLRAEIAFLGEDNIGNASAVRNLMAMGRRPGAKAEYAHAKQRSRLQRLLPGVEVHVLGPPTIAQTDTILKQRSRDEQEYWHLRARAAEGLPGIGGGKVQPLFPNAIPGSGLPIQARWLAEHLRKVRFQQMHSIVRILDKAMNNTSLILLFRVGGKSLLFPGDAQIENWNYALSQKRIVKMLSEVDVYKVGHHGSLNATPKTLWASFAKRSRNAQDPNRLTSLMSTMEGKHGHVDRKTEVPRRTLAADLEKDSNLFSTQSLTQGELFHDTKIALA